MLERQREGIAKADADGKYKGRKPTARAKAEDAVRLFLAGKQVAHIAKEVGIGRGSVYRALDAEGVLLDPGSVVRAGSIWSPASSQRLIASSAGKLCAL